MRRIVKLTVVSAAALVAALGLTVSGTTPARAIAPPQYYITAGGGDTNPPFDYWLHAHADYSAIDVESVPGTLQSWRLVYLGTFSGFSYWQLALATTNWCATYALASDNFELEPCSSSFNSLQAFYVASTGGSFEGASQFWILNVFASNYWGQNEYMTAATDNQARDAVYADPAGHGMNAVWTIDCEANC